MKSRTLTSVKGVYSAGIAAQIKTNGKRDLAFIYVPRACASAGVFTQSAFAAPPVLHTRECLKRGTIKALIVNSGCANAATGKPGLRDTKRTAAIAANLLGLKPQEVAVASTGIIGRPLPMDRIEAGLNQLLSNPHARDGESTAQAIMTTDLTQKEVFVSATIGGHKVTVAGCAKGSGMIAPNMATMLAFLTTDAKIDSRSLQAALKVAVNDSFNMTSVDTDTSTNDAVVVFATGESQANLRSAQAKATFVELLTRACQGLAKKIAADGEGATKLIEVRVQGAKNVAQARRIAMNIVNSPLVKTAIHGADPNWGRVLAAAGKDPGLKVDPSRVDLKFAETPVMKMGAILPHDRQKVHKLMQAREINIELNLNLGQGCAKAWGCDLTHGYVDINVSYN